MRPFFFSAAMAFALATTATAESHGAMEVGGGYSAADLLSPCQEADNDARWGEAAEVECEQYLVGFVHALEITGQTGPEAGICLPDANVPDEVRWAYMRWVHGSYTKRKAMGASEAVMATLKDSFPCE